MLVPTVIEKSSQGERAYDIFSRLLNDRIVMLHGQVDDQSASLVVSQMLYLESKSSSDILFYINSPGGSVTAGMSIYDTMQYINSDVTTIVLGQAASMGSLLAQSGAPGKRYVLPNVRHMIHQPLGGTGPHTQASDIEITAKEIMRWKDALTRIYEKHNTGGKKYKQLEADMDRDNFMTAEESVKYGLADKVIDKKPENS